MSFIWFLIIGGIIGWLAGLILGKDIPGGIIGNIIAGIVGAWIGGMLLGEWGPRDIGLLHLACVTWCDHPCVYCEPDHEINA